MPDGRVKESILQVLRAAYLREPRRGFRSSDCRTLLFFRLGFEILKVPLPTYSA
jgi:hypothetical protein